MLREAALADSVSVVRNHFEPWRGLPERRLPADSRLPGHWPAQEARWALVAAQTTAGELGQHLRVVLVSGSIFQERIGKGIEAAHEVGASAYVLKSRAVLELADTVHAVALSAAPATSWLSVAID